MSNKLYEGHLRLSSQENHCQTKTPKAKTVPPRPRFLAERRKKSSIISLGPAGFGARADLARPCHSSSTQQSFSQLTQRCS
jgi:hypothetical protein